ncbi:hypothetical protein G6F56_008319 [Rhizopus delemar]|nr:hypothetical protein G6F56_008319 [Rhizopus delemar]
MKIKRTPIKTLPSLPPELINIIDHLLTGGPISRWTVKEWKFPKSDFFQFVSVLNLFDDKLDSLCKTYELNVHIQNKPFDENDKQTLLSILNFTRLLFDNCSNRNLYNSYEYLNSLLYTTDIDILEATLALLLKPAQRMNNPTAAQSNFSIKDETVITELAKNGDITLFTSNETTNVKKLSASFYKEEGGELETIDVSLSAKPDQDIFWETVNKHQIPSGYHFELLNKIRLANHNHSISTRRQLLKIRLMSIVILGRDKNRKGNASHTMPEATAQNRLYIYEPNLTAQIVQLLSFENQIPTDIQTYALYALDAIARHKMKLTEVLNTLNAAANHGILLHTLRQLSSGPVFPQAFLDAFFTLLSFLIDTVAGGQMLSSAGIVNACVHIIDNEHAKPNVLTKVISVLDIAFDSLENAYPNFFHSNGLNASISALKIQVDICVSEPQHHDSTILVKTILRFIIRMIKSSHAGSTLRNLMETSVPLILTKIMDQQKLVGSTMFGLALSLYASYIHMEPTSLTVLEELQVPQTFLKAFMAYEGYCDVNLLLNVIDAFSATCLSEQGLDMFQEIQPLPYFFKLMSSEHFLKNPVEVTETSEIGGEMSELVRHQPALKVQMFSCIHTMLQKVVTLGKSELPEDETIYYP